MPLKSWYATTTTLFCGWRLTFCVLKKMRGISTRKLFSGSIVISTPSGSTAAFHTWLYRIVSNLCLDQLRKRKVRKEEPSTRTVGDSEFDRLASVPEERASVDPQRQVMSSELSGRIQEALTGLSPRERLVFEMRHYQGMRLRSIGDALGTTEEAAKNCLFRATQKMRAALGDFV